MELQYVQEIVSHLQNAVGNSRTQDRQTELEKASALFAKLQNEFRVSSVPLESSATTVPSDANLSASSTLVATHEQKPAPLVSNSDDNKVVKQLNEDATYKQPAAQTVTSVEQGLPCSIDKVELDRTNFPDLYQMAHAQQSSQLESVQKLEAPAAQLIAEHPAEPEAIIKTVEPSIIEPSAPAAALVDIEAAQPQPSAPILILEPHVPIESKHPQTSQVGSLKDLDRDKSRRCCSTSCLWSVLLIGLAVSVLVTGLITFQLRDGGSSGLGLVSKLAIGGSVLVVAGGAGIIRIEWLLRKRKSTAAGLCFDLTVGGSWLLIHAALTVYAVAIGGAGTALSMWLQVAACVSIALGAAWYLIRRLPVGGIAAWTLIVLSFFALAWSGFGLWLNSRAVSDTAVFAAVSVLFSTAFAFAGLSDHGLLFLLVTFLGCATSFAWSLQRSLTGSDNAPTPAIVLVLQLLVAAVLSHTHRVRRVWINLSNAILFATSFLHQIVGVIGGVSLPALYNIDVFGVGGWEGGQPVVLLCAELLFVPALFRHRASFLPPFLAAGILFTNTTGLYVCFAATLPALLLILLKYEPRPYNEDDGAAAAVPAQHLANNKDKNWMWGYITQATVIFLFVSWIALTWRQQSSQQQQWALSVFLVLVWCLSALFETRGQGVSVGVLVMGSSPVHLTTTTFATVLAVFGSHHAVGYLTPQQPFFWLDYITLVLAIVVWAVRAQHTSMSINEDKTVRTFIALFYACLLGFGGFGDAFGFAHYWGERSGFDFIFLVVALLSYALFSALTPLRHVTFQRVCSIPDGILQKYFLKHLDKTGWIFLGTLVCVGKSSLPAYWAGELVNGAEEDLWTLFGCATGVCLCGADYFCTTRRIPLVQLKWSFVWLALWSMSPWGIPQAVLLVVMLATAIVLSVRHQVAPARAIVVAATLFGVTAATVFALHPSAVGYRVDKTIIFGWLLLSLGVVYNLIEPSADVSSRRRSSTSLTDVKVNDIKTDPPSNLVQPLMSIARPREAPPSSGAILWSWVLIVAGCLTLSRAPDAVHRQIGPVVATLISCRALVGRCYYRDDSESGAGCCWSGSLRHLTSAWDARILNLMAPSLLVLHEGVVAPVEGALLSFNVLGSLLLVWSIATQLVELDALHSLSEADGVTLYLFVTRGAFIAGNLLLAFQTDGWLPRAVFVLFGVVIVGASTRSSQPVPYTGLLLCLLLAWCPSEIALVAANGFSFPGSMALSWGLVYWCAILTYCERRYLLLSNATWDWGGPCWHRELYIVKIGVWVAAEVLLTQWTQGWFTSSACLLLLAACVVSAVFSRRPDNNNSVWKAFGTSTAWWEDCVWVLAVFVAGEIPSIILDPVVYPRLGIGLILWTAAIGCCQWLDDGGPSPSWNKALFWLKVVCGVTGWCLQSAWTSGWAGRFAVLAAFCACLLRDSWVDELKVLLLLICINESIVFSNFNALAVSLMLWSLVAAVCQRLDSSNAQGFPRYGLMSWLKLATLALGCCLTSFSTEAWMGRSYAALALGWCLWCSLNRASKGFGLRMTYWEYDMPLLLLLITVNESVWMTTSTSDPASILPLAAQYVLWSATVGIAQRCDCSVQVTQLFSPLSWLKMSCFLIGSLMLTAATHAWFGRIAALFLASLCLLDAALPKPADLKDKVAIISHTAFPLDLLFVLTLLVANEVLYGTLFTTGQEQMEQLQLSLGIALMVWALLGGVSQRLHVMSQPGAVYDWLSFWTLSSLLEVLSVLTGTCLLINDTSGWFGRAVFLGTSFWCLCAAAMSRHVPFLFLVNRPRADVQLAGLTLVVNEIAFILENGKGSAMLGQISLGVGALLWVGIVALVQRLDDDAVHFYASNWWILGWKTVCLIAGTSLLSPVSHAWVGRAVAAWMFMWALGTCRFKNTNGAISDFLFDVADWQKNLLIVIPTFVASEVTQMSSSLTPYSYLPLGILFTVHGCILVSCQVIHSWTTKKVDVKGEVVAVATLSPEWVAALGTGTLVVGCALLSQVTDGWIGRVFFVVGLGCTVHNAHGSPNPITLPAMVLLAAITILETVYIMVSGGSYIALGVLYCLWAAALATSTLYRFSWQPRGVNLVKVAVFAVGTGLLCGWTEGWWGRSCVIQFTGWNFLSSKRQQRYWSSDWRLDSMMTLSILLVNEAIFLSTIPSLYPSSSMPAYVLLSLMLFIWGMGTVASVLTQPNWSAEYNKNLWIAVLGGLATLVSILMLSIWTLGWVGRTCFGIGLIALLAMTVKLRITVASNNNNNGGGAEQAQSSSRVLVVFAIGLLLLEIINEATFMIGSDNNRLYLGLPKYQVLAIAMLVWSSIGCTLIEPQYRDTGQVTLSSSESSATVVGSWTVLVHLVYTIGAWMFWTTGLWTPILLSIALVVHLYRRHAIPFIFGSVNLLIASGLTIQDGNAVAAVCTLASALGLLFRFLTLPTKSWMLYYTDGCSGAANLTSRLALLLALICSYFTYEYGYAVLALVAIAESTRTLVVGRYLGVLLLCGPPALSAALSLTWQSLFAGSPPSSQTFFMGLSLTVSAVVYGLVYQSVTWLYTPAFWRQDLVVSASQPQPEAPRKHQCPSPWTSVTFIDAHQQVVDCWRQCTTVWISTSAWMVIGALIGNVLNCYDDETEAMCEGYTTLFPLVSTIVAVVLFSAGWKMHGKPRWGVGLRGLAMVIQLAGAGFAFKTLIQSSAMQSTSASVSLIVSGILELLMVVADRVIVGVFRCWSDENSSGKTESKNANTVVIDVRPRAVPPDALLV